MMPSLGVEVCPICQGPSYHSFFKLDSVPTQDGLLWNSKNEAITAPTGDIRLAWCQRCDYVGNLLFQPDKIRYDKEYSFSLYASPTYREFTHQLASRLIKQFNLSNRTILEIGCGQGDFLRLLCELGSNRGIGIDPSVNTHVEHIGANEIVFYQDCYSGRHADLDVDFICCRQVLDQLNHPRAFVETVRSHVGRCQSAGVYFEVPNATNIFEDLLVRNIMYEKCSWFTPNSISSLFAVSGFATCTVEPCFESGQYLGVEAVPAASRTPPSSGTSANSEQFARAINSFSERYRGKVSDWKDQFSALLRNRRRPLMWGAGSGAITFLTALNIGDELPFVVDINPKRQGKFLPRTGQQVVSPEFFRKQGADVLIITNSTYEAEIRREVSAMGINCNYWVI